MDIPTLTTARLILRPFVQEDAEPLWHILSQTDVLRHFPNPNPPSIERVQRLIAHQLAHWEAHGLGWWAVERRSSPGLIGWCGLQFLPETDQVEVGYLLHRGQWGQGLAGEAARASVQYGFQTLGLREIIALVAPENRASIRVAEKLAMRLVDRINLWGMDLLRFARHRLQGTFVVDGDRFLLDGSPFRILSGAMHYFRVLPQCWDDRLRKLQAMGLNTLETYVAWNLHEPVPGAFRFDGRLDVVDYIRRAADLGLYALVRPGPYICSEWEMGGLPAWLLKDPAMRLRCTYRPYLDAVDRFFDALIPRLVPLQVTHGGPILALQVENEYGSYGNDAAYLRYLEEGLRARGIDVLLFTSDGPRGETLQAGTLPHLLKTVNFGRGAADAFAKLREYQPEGPLMCTEFWDGWFDHWGEPHHTHSASDAAETLDEILAHDASANLYMFHGGTSFGFMNGANCEDGLYRPTITSYDYDAPLSEAGDPTAKYWALREVIGRYRPLGEPPTPAPSPKMAVGPVELPEVVSLFDVLDDLSVPLRSPVPEPMETWGQSYGYCLYRTHVSGPRHDVVLTIRGLHDRAQVWLGGQYVDTYEREHPDKAVRVEVPPHGTGLDLLVENMGRINFGPDLADRKGILEGVLLDGQYLMNWTVYPLPLDDLARLRFGAAGADGPAFFRGVFPVDEPRDTFLALPGWTKGVVWINGFNLGRYWERGPQRTLYVPAPLLRQGENRLVVFEQYRTRTQSVEFCNRPDLG